MSRLCAPRTPWVLCLIFGGFASVLANRETLRLRSRSIGGEHDALAADVSNMLSFWSNGKSTNWQWMVDPKQKDDSEVSTRHKHLTQQAGLGAVETMEAPDNKEFNAEQTEENGTSGGKRDFGAYNSGKRVLGGYGMRTQKAMLKWWNRSVPWGNGPVICKVFFVTICVILFVGPFLTYHMFFGMLLRNTQITRSSHPVVDETVNQLRLPLKLICSFGCMYTVGALLKQGADEDYPLLDDIMLALSWVVTIALFSIPVRILSKVDRYLHEMARERVTNKTYLKKREMMTAITQGAHIVAPSKASEELGYFLYNYIWRPFHWFTITVIVLMIVFEIIGDTCQSFILVVAYTLVTFMMAIFGGRTLGPELYGGLVLFFERPFVEGDIITVDKMGSKGGAATDVAGSVVTGFVERIGIRSVTVRRFDMRAVWVPNSYFMSFAVANWNTRPRKLIYIQFAASHRTPVELCKVFQEKVLYAVKNHTGVDQQMYIKAVFRKLDSGMNFLLVCFNARGTKKQNVQQDLIFTILGLARKLEIELVFEQRNVYMEREAVPEGKMYVGNEEPTILQDQIMKDAKCLDSDLGALLPVKKDLTATVKQQFAPDGMIVVRLEAMTMFQVQSASFLVCDCNHGISGRFWGGDENGICSLCGKETQAHFRQNATNPTEIAAEGQKSKTRAFRIKIRVVPEGMDDMSSVPWNAHLEKDKISRIALLNDQKSSQRKVSDDFYEVKFFENIAFVIDDDDGTSTGSIPKKMEFHAMQVSKGFKNWTWNCPQERLGVVVADVHKLVKKARSNSQAHPLDLVDTEGRVVGNLHLQVLVPEKHDQSIMGDLSD